MHRGLLWAAAALPVANVVHALAPAAHHQHEAIAGPIMGTLLTAGGIAAFVGVLHRRSWAPALALAVGVATIAGFALFHALPLQTAVTEPYWGENGSATAGQAATLVLIAAVAVWLIVEARAALLRPGDS
jgi:hypothetical protein